MSKLPDWDIAAGVRKTVAVPKKRAPAPPPADETDEQRTQRRLLSEFRRAAAKRRLRELHNALPEKVAEAARLASWATRRPDLVGVARRAKSTGALFHVPDGWPNGVDPEEATRDFIAETFPRPDGIEKTDDEDTWFQGGDDGK